MTPEEADAADAGTAGLQQEGRIPQLSRGGADYARRLRPSETTEQEKCDGDRDGGRHVQGQQRAYGEQQEDPGQRQEQVRSNHQSALPAAAEVSSHSADQP